MKINIKDVYRNKNGCWIWSKSKIKSGYPVIGISGKKYYVHRLIWRLSNGEIPRGKFVLHRCDNPSCVYIKHLFLGSHDENMLDMARKGRSPSNMDHWHTKLSTKNVLRIRILDGIKTHKELSKMFNISQSHVSRIINRQRRVI